MGQRFIVAINCFGVIVRVIFVIKVYFMRKGVLKGTMAISYLVSENFIIGQGFIIKGSMVIRAIVLILEWAATFFEVVNPFFLVAYVCNIF